MTERTKSAILAFVTGSSGSSAQFTGKTQLGWTILMSSWVILPGIFWAFRTYTSINTSMLTFLFFGIIGLEHLLLFFYHLNTLPPDQTIEQVKSRNGRIIISVASMALLAWASFQWAFQDPHIDTSMAEPVATLQSVDFSSAFLQDEDAFRKKYDRKVVRLHGKVHSMGEDFTEGLYIALESAAGSPADVNCFFLPERQSDIANIAAGDMITVTGIADGQFLRNCYLNANN